MLDSFLMAFSMYSRIPVPHVKWNEKGLRLCICFLPAVGAVIGLAQAGLFVLMTYLSFGPVLRGAVLTACPLFLSGGIHMDGFLDVCDAIHSYAGREKKLEILKDPHVGAFAVIGGIIWGLLSLGIWSEGGGEEMPVLCMTFVLSRALSAFAALVFPKAKKDGMLHEETAPVPGGAAAAMAAVSASVCVAMILVSWMSAEGPAGVLPALAGIGAAFLSLAWYHHVAMTAFGGTTGDLSGWFTQICELASAAVIVTVAALLRAAA